MADETFDIGAEDAAALGALADAFNPRAGGAARRRRSAGARHLGA